MRFWGTGKSQMAAVLHASRVQPSALTVYPQKGTVWAPKMNFFGAESNSVLRVALQDGADMRHVIRKSRVVNKAVVDNLGEIADVGEGGVSATVELVAGRDESLRVSAKPVSAPWGHAGCEGLGVL